MRKILFIVLAVILSTTLSECRFTRPSTVEPPINEQPNDEVPVITDPVTGLEYIVYENDLYHEFFSLDSIVEIQMDVDPSELALIQSDFDYDRSINSKSPIYRKADITFTINDTVYVFEEVGIRMKGNTSRTSFFNIDNGMYDMIHFKLSFSETFDDPEDYANPKVWDAAARRERKNRLFAGMEKLDLKWNRVKDETYSREFWIYDMFRSFGVLAQNITPVNFKINYSGEVENFGVVYALETIDTLFLEKRLSSKHLGGDLYKVGWDNQYGGNLTLNTLDRIGIEDEKVSYFPIYDLKTNKKTSDHSHMRNLILKLNNENSPSDVVHLDYYIAFEAASFLSGNPDDLRNHYNNYYIYFLNDSGLAIFIPYDYDRNMGINWDWNPTGNSMTSYSPYTKRTTMGEGNNQVNPLILKTIARDSGMDQLILDYRALILEMIDSKYFDINQFKAIYDINQAKYGNLTQYSIAALSGKSVSFNFNETINMAVSEYMMRKVQTVNNLIDSYQ
jgi:spore coat protein CotH